MRILVTGGSVSAHTLAYFLARSHHSVVLQERAPNFREGGQNVDIRGAARLIIQRMGLEVRVKALNTGEEGVAFVDEDDKARASFLVKDIGANGPTAELEILRGDLAKVIYEAAVVRASGKEDGDVNGDQVDELGRGAKAAGEQRQASQAKWEEKRSGNTTFRFGDHITAITPSPSSATLPPTSTSSSSPSSSSSSEVQVTLNSGKTETYDLIISAEGVGSSTRELVFPGENEPRYMDITTAFFTIPRAPTDSSVARWYNAPAPSASSPAAAICSGGRSIFIRPDPHGTTRAGLNISSPPPDRSSPSNPLRTAAEQKAFFRTAFADVGWEAPRVLEGMDASDDFYFDVVRQVKMSRWSDLDKRVVLTGDAAWCATPLSGIGTSLAIVGAYVLAGELVKVGAGSGSGSGSGSVDQDELQKALERYETTMRPYVDAGQGVPKLVPRIGHPQSAWGIEAYRSFLGFMARPWVSGTLGKLFVPKADKVQLPEYTFP